MTTKNAIIFGGIITVTIISFLGFSSSTKEVSILESNSKADTNKTAFLNFDVTKTNTTPDRNQNLSYFVRAYNQQGILYSITQEKLSKANSLSDIIENYPSSWIKVYNSVEFSTFIDGKEAKVSNQNEILTEKQKQFLNKIAIGSELSVLVKYQKENYNNQIQVREMEVQYIVSPKNPATFIEGYEKLIAYLKENSLAKIQSKKLSVLPQPSISFIINNKGLVENVVLDKTSGDTEIDKTLIKAVKAMPKWKPAKNAKGLNVKQKFVLDLGMNC